MRTRRRLTSVTTTSVARNANVEILFVHSIILRHRIVFCSREPLCGSGSGGRRRTSQFVFALKFYVSVFRDDGVNVHVKRTRPRIFFDFRTITFAPTLWRVDGAGSGFPPANTPGRPAGALSSVGRAGERWPILFFARETTRVLSHDEIIAARTYVRISAKKKEKKTTITTATSRIRFDEFDSGGQSVDCAVVWPDHSYFRSAVGDVGGNETHESIYSADSRLTLRGKFFRSRSNRPRAARSPRVRQTDEILRAPQIKNTRSQRLRGPRRAVFFFFFRALLLVDSVGGTLGLLDRIAIPEEINKYRLRSRFRRSAVIGVLPRTLLIVHRRLSPSPPPVYDFRVPSKMVFFIFGIL